jgi:hypothetical protein
MTRRVSVGMGKEGMGFAVAALLVAVLASSPVHAHEQQTLTIILNDEGAVVGNISDPAFVQGNAVWFKMHDTTENATMQIGIDLDGDGFLNGTEDFISSTLVESCELDDNGSLVDETCEVSALYAFPTNATVGTYQYWVMRDVDNVTTNWTYEIQLFEDIHDDGGPSPGDCFGAGCDDDLSDTSGDEDVVEDGLSQDDLVKLTAVIAGVAIVFLTLSILGERNVEHKPKRFEEE